MTAAALLDLLSDMLEFSHLPEEKITVLCNITTFSVRFEFASTAFCALAVGGHWLYNMTSVSVYRAYLN